MTYNLDNEVTLTFNECPHKHKVKLRTIMHIALPILKEIAEKYDGDDMISSGDMFVEYLRHEAHKKH